MRNSRAVVFFMLILVFGTFFFNMHGMTEAGPTAQPLNEERLRVVAGSMEKIQSSAEMLRHKIVRRGGSVQPHEATPSPIGFGPLGTGKSSFDKSETVEVLNKLGDLFEGLPEATVPKSVTQSTEQSQRSFRRVLSEVHRKVKGVLAIDPSRAFRQQLYNKLEQNKDKLVALLISLKYTDKNKDNLNRLIESFNNRDDKEVTNEAFRNLLWDSEEGERIKKALLPIQIEESKKKFSQCIEKHLWVNVKKLASDMGSLESYFEDTSNFPFNFPRDLRGMLPKDERSYGLVVEFVLKGALVDLGLIVDKNKEEKYQHLKSEFSEKIKEAVSNNPYLFRFAKSLQSKLVVEIFLNVNGDGLSQRGREWKDNLSRIFPDTAD